MEMTLKDKARAVVSFDHEINGDYVNAPYKIFHNGETYKVEVYVRNRETDGVSVPQIRIIRPATIMADCELNEIERFSRE